jgi:hypothetical protein
MVSAAMWTDFNNDNKPDLVLAGEFMRITLLKNNGSNLVDITDETSLRDAYGMWNSLLSADFDNDGDVDFVAGNLGLNTPFRVAPEEPLEVHYADFDQNGSVDPIFSSYEDGVAYPLASMDQLTTQLPMLKKHLSRYRTYARTTTKDLLRLTGNNAFETLTCKVLTTLFIENLGNDQFAVHPLPLSAQVAPVNGIAAEDINMDGKLDLVLVGNSYHTEVVNGRYDASVGMVLLNTGNNKFKPVTPDQTNFVVRGDARAMVRVELSDNNSILVVTQNDDSLKSFTIDTYRRSIRIKASMNEISAIAALRDGTIRVIEFQSGSSYMSQGTKTIVITPAIIQVEFFDSKGRSTRILNDNDLNDN